MINNQNKQKHTKERVIYALKNGIMIGLLVYVVMGFFQMNKTSFQEAYMTWAALKRLFFYLLGASLGYYFFGWWADEEKRNKNL